MSKTTRVTDLEILSDKAIKAAVAQLKKDGVAVTLLENAAPRMYYADQFAKAQRALGKKDTAEFVLHLGDTMFDVGLVKEGKRYEVMADVHANKVASVLGAKGLPTSYGEAARLKHSIGKFTLEYSVQNSLLTARSKGMSPVRVINPKTGLPQIKIPVYA